MLPLLLSYALYAPFPEVFAATAAVVLADTRLLPRSLSSVYCAVEFFLLVSTVLLCCCYAAMPI